MPVPGRSSYVMWASSATHVCLRAAVCLLFAVSCQQWQHLVLSCAGMGGTGGLSASRGTAMLSFRPGEKLYVRRRSGSRCNFFDSLEDFRFVSRRLLLLSGPAEANSVPLCLAGSRDAPASCMSDLVFSAPPVDFLRLLLLRKGHMPMVPFVLSKVQ